MINKETGAEAKDLKKVKEPTKKPQKEISIVIPIYNEEELLQKEINYLHGKLTKFEADFELILSENGSTDNSKAIIRQITKLLDNIKEVHLPEPNYGAALKEGINKANSSYVFIFDIDYFNIDFLKDALKILKNEKYDIVIASKLAAGADDKRGFARRIITKGFSLFIKTLFKVKVKETHGMKAFNKDAIETIIKSTRSEYDIFDTELIIRAELAELKIKEIPATVEEKRPTRSSIFKRIPRTVIGLLKLRYNLKQEGLL